MTVTYDMLRLRVFKDHSRTFDANGHPRCLCMICEKVAAHDLHHIIPRSHLGDPRLYWTIPAELCAPVCRRCHEKADTNATRCKLIVANAALYNTPERPNRMLAAYLALCGNAHKTFPCVENFIYQVSKTNNPEVCLE